MLPGLLDPPLRVRLIERGESVRGMDNFATGKRENIADLKGKLDFRRSHPFWMRPLWPMPVTGIDYVFHEAALPSVPKSVVEPEFTQCDQREWHAESAAGGA